ncbi:uncharacterized protein LOC110113283 [Dendrobium catenatum]|uniref:uncharacterized protein LOC110113283 n=1 Tax=Dendrobium catenatum TaxID=906689 RepID=UPI0009F29286|nr:uncharacterized protein LOC110113283 [Dendrobium catenatum]
MTVDGRRPPVVHGHHRSTVKPLVIRDVTDTLVKKVVDFMEDLPIKPALQSGIDGNSSKINTAKNAEIGSKVTSVLGSNIPFPVCSRELQKQWSRFGNFHLTTFGLDWILYSFTKPEAVEEILEGGPWFIGGNIIELDRWYPNVSPESLKGLTAPIWIRMPNLPLHCWDEQNIYRIASKIGTLIYLDGNSFKWGKREYAHVCSCLNLDKKVPNSVWIEGMHGRSFQKVVYEKISSLCYHCGKLGHLKNQCSLINNSTSKTAAPNSNFIEKNINQGEDNANDQDEPYLGYRSSSGKIGLREKQLKQTTVSQIYLPIQANLIIEEGEIIEQNASQVLESKAIYSTWENKNKEVMLKNSFRICEEEVQNFCFEGSKGNGCSTELVKTNSDKEVLKDPANSISIMTT